MRLFKPIGHSTLRVSVRRYVWALLMLGCLVPPASAQVSISSSLPNAALVPAPPLPDFADRRLVFVPFLTVSERYDDNIFLSSSNREHDFVTTISPGARLHYVPRADTRLDFDYRADFEIFADNSDQNQVAHRANLQFAGQLTRLIALKARNRFVLSEDPGDRGLGSTQPQAGDSGPQDVTPPGGGNVRSEQTRERVLRNNANVALEVQVTPRIDLTPSFSSLIHDVNNPDEVDNLNYSIGAEIGYLTDITRRNRAFIGYDADFFTFRENGRPRPDVNDFVVHTTNIGYRHAFSPTLTGEASIGYAVSVSEAANVDDDSAVIGTVGIAKALRDGEISFRYQRRFTAGGGEGGRALGDLFALAISTNISPKIVLALSSNLSLVDFQEAAGNDRVFWIIRPSLAYQVLRFWNVSVAYDYARTDTDSAGDDRSDHRLTLASQLAIRDRFILSLAYRYSSRSFDDTMLGSNTRDDDFDRHQVALSLTYAFPVVLR